MTHPLDALLAGHLCAGCGACAYVGGDHGVTMVDVAGTGRRPAGPRQLPIAVKDQIVAVCPSATLRSPAMGTPPPRDSAELQVGPTKGIWEGWAADPEIRRAASSGGVVTALALYCLEQLGMGLVVHTGMDPVAPWLNRTILSASRPELLAACGSRYAPSSPVEALAAIEAADGPCVFIGKPCDVAAVAELRRTRPRLDENLGLVLSFFCAGTPATFATLSLADTLGFGDPSGIASVKYRGDGWPGQFRVRDSGGREASLTYEESWGALARRHRQLRCHLCPDGLGELSDVTGGDAWHRKAEGTDGISLILARTERGRRAVEGAVAAGYLIASPSDPSRVVVAQGLIRRRRLVAARLAAMRLLWLRTPTYQGFRLLSSARIEGPVAFVREFLGTVQRAWTRQYRRAEPSPEQGAPEHRVREEN